MVSYHGAAVRRTGVRRPVGPPDTRSRNRPSPRTRRDDQHRRGLAAIADVLADHRVQPADPRGLVVGHVHDGEAAEVLLGLDVRRVGEDGVAADRLDTAHRGGRRHCPRLETSPRRPRRALPRPHRPLHHLTNRKLIYTKILTSSLLGAAPDPTSAARLTKGQITAALNRARRRNVAEKATAIQVALRAEQLGQPAVVTAAYAAMVRAQVAILTTLNTEINTMQEQVEAHFGQHPDAEIYL